MLRKLKQKLNNLELRWANTSAKRYVTFLRKKGVVIGENLWITPFLNTVVIDITRPSLVTIGNNVRINKNFTLLTHDGGFYTLLNKYHEFIPQSGPVKIGNNVYFGRNCSVFKGVTIGDNCIIGFGSVVTKDIPSNSVAVGAPAKVIATIDEYYAKRCKISVEEAFVYARSIQERWNRLPKVEEFWEEFPLFVDKENMHLYPTLPYKLQLGASYDIWVKNHKRQFNDFEEFLSAAGVK